MKFLSLHPEVEKKDARFVYFLGNIEPIDGLDTPQNGVLNIDEDEMPPSIFTKLWKKWRGKPVDKVRAKDSVEKSVLSYRKRLNALLSSTALTPDAHPEELQAKVQYDVTKAISDKTIAAQHKKTDWKGQYPRMTSPTDTGSTLKIFHPGFAATALGIDKMPPLNFLGANAWPGPSTLVLTPASLFSMFDGSNPAARRNIEESKQNIFDSFSNAKNPYGNVAAGLIKGAFEPTLEAYKKATGVTPGFKPKKALENASLAVLDSFDAIQNEMSAQNFDDTKKADSLYNQRLKSTWWGTRGFRQYTGKLANNMAYMGQRNIIAKTKDRIHELRQILTVRNRDINSGIVQTMQQSQLSGDFKTQDDIQAQIIWALNNPIKFIDSGYGGDPVNTTLESVTGLSNKAVILDALNSFYSVHLLALKPTDRANANNEESLGRIKQRYDHLEGNAEADWPNFLDIQSELQCPSINIEQFNDEVNAEQLQTALSKGISDAFDINLVDIYNEDPHTTVLYAELEAEEQIVYLLKYLTGGITNAAMKRLNKNKTQTLLQQLPHEAQAQLLRYLNDGLSKVGSAQISGGAVEEEGSITLRADMASRATNVISLGMKVTDPEFPATLAKAARSRKGEAFRDQLAFLEDFVDSYDSFQSFFEGKKTYLLKPDVDAFGGLLKRVADFKDRLSGGDGFIAKILEERVQYAAVLKNLGADNTTDPTDHTKHFESDVDKGISGEEIWLEAKIFEFSKALKDSDPSMKVNTNTEVQVDTTRTQSLQAQIDKWQNKLNTIRDARNEAESFSFSGFRSQGFHDVFSSLETDTQQYINSANIDRSGEMDLSNTDSRSNMNERFKRVLKTRIHRSMEKQIKEELTQAADTSLEMIDRLEMGSGFNLSKLSFIRTDHVGGELMFPAALNSQIDLSAAKIRFKADGHIFLEAMQDGKPYVYVIDRNQDSETGFSAIKVYKKTKAMDEMFQQANPYAFLPKHTDMTGLVINVQSQKIKEAA